MTAAPPPEFSRPHPIPARPKEPIEVSETATPAECDALARRFGVVSLSDVSVEATIRAWRDGGLRVTGEARATAVQEGVADLEPVEQAIAERFDRGFVPGLPEGEEVELVDDEELGDLIEPMPDALDIGEIAAEAIGLGLDPYPRPEGSAPLEVEAAPPGAEPIEEESPFAKLAALKGDG